MKLVFLNCLKGKLGKPLTDFMQNQMGNTDIFCFAEFPSSLKSLLYENSFVSFEKGQQAIFVKNNLNCENYKCNRLYGEISVSGFTETSGYIQGVYVKDSQTFSIFNIWGMAYPGDKLDTKLRIRQSEIILSFVKDFPKPHILIGDFNLMPETVSVEMIETANYRNLIKEFDIKSTRNKIAWEYFEKSKKDKFFGRQYYADYRFVSKDVKVKKFTVPNIEVSDHLPLILESEV